MFTNQNNILLFGWLSDNIYTLPIPSINVFLNTFFTIFKSFFCILYLHSRIGNLLNITSTYRFVFLFFYTILIFTINFWKCGKCCMVTILGMMFMFYILILILKFSIIIKTFILVDEKNKNKIIYFFWYTINNNYI